MLIFQDIHLIPCQLFEDEEGYELQFNTVGLEGMEALKKERETIKLRFLINCSELSRLYKKYYFTLDFENIYYDMNLIPKILDRNCQQNYEAELLGQYKALVAAVLAPKYSFKDYVEGGEDLYRKNKKVKDYLDADTIEEIRDKLLVVYKEKCAYERKKKTLVKKSEIIRYRIEMPIFAILAAVAVVLCGYLYFVEKRYDDSVIRAHEAYLTEDYFGVQNALVSIEVERLDTYSKFILAKSYVISESLTNTQKENVLSSLTVKTEEIALNYWIFLGRLEFESAIEQAQRLGDNDLLMYAYIKYKAYVSDNMTMNGEEKAALINTLESQIEELEKQMIEDREQITK